MQQVYAPANSAEAHMLAHLLEQNGIVAHIHGEALQGGVGELPAAGLLQLLVADEEYHQARALIAEWERKQVPASEQAQERPRVPFWTGLIVLAIGVGGGWVLKTAAARNAIPIDASEARFDQNVDGRDDLIYFYRVGSANAHKATVDLNFDGDMDSTDYYDSEGVLVRREADENFDGFIESRTTYRAGVARRTEIDRNRNGVADIQVFYRDGIVSREEIHDNGAGRLARVNYYANFLLTRSESDLNGDGSLETVRTYNELGEITATETRPPR